SRLAANTASANVGGAVVLVAALAAAVAAGLAAWLAVAPAWAPSRRARGVLVAACAIVAVAGVLAVVHSGPAQPRGSYWHVAWHDEARLQPLHGTGAGTFGFYWIRFGSPAVYGGALDAH